MLALYHQYFAVVVQVVVGSMFLFSATPQLHDENTVLIVMRTYALYDRDRRILVMLTIVGLGLIGVSLVSPFLKSA
jgi:hypothetical protein